MKIIFLILSVFFPAVSFGQSFSIKGLVADETGKPLPYVNIVILETGTGAASDTNGQYIIENLVPGNYRVDFSIIGYTSHSETVNIKDESVIINVVLEQAPVVSDQVVVTAGKYEQKISDLPVSAEVIGNEFLIQKNITDFEDLLRYVPGVNMTDDQISIRGSSGYSRGAGSRVLLAIDGITFYTGDTGETIWEILPVTEIDRVEVIKGAASSLYGSTAIGGVVNVLTKRISAQPLIYFKSHIGAYDSPSYDEWKWSEKLRIFNGFSLSHSQQISDFGYTASFTRLEDTGYKQNNNSKKIISFLKAAYNFSPSSSLTLIGNGLTKKSGNFVYWKNSRNALVPPDADLNQTVRTDRYMAGLIYKDLFSDDFLLTINSSYYRTDWEDGSTPNNISKTNLYRADIQTNYHISENIILVSGIEGAKADISSTLFDTTGFYSFGAYTQADINFSFPLIATAGIRFDFNKLETMERSNAVSPKVGINYKINTELILRSSAGLGFRAPTPAEAFTSTTASGITVKPNPALKPERNLTFEAGMNYQPNSFISFDFALFQNEFYDFIEAGFDTTDSRVMFDNVTRARIQGCEVNTHSKIFETGLSLNLNYTYLYSRDINEKKALKYRPRHISTVSLAYISGPLTAGADFRYWSRVEEIDDQLAIFVPDGGLRVAAYILDLRAGYDLVQTGFPVRLYFNINNVLNYNYLELIGNLAPVRNFSLSVELEIK